MPSAARTRTYRMFPPVGRSVFTTQRGQIIDATVAGFYDAISQDADALQAAGWMRVTEIGTTANRPYPGQSTDNPGQIIVFPAGYRYYDTTLGADIFWNPSKQIWTTITNTAA